jgi:hypothetical protein
MHELSIECSSAFTFTYVHACQCSSMLPRACPYLSMFLNAGANNTTSTSSASNSIASASASIGISTSTCTSTSTY